MNDSYSKWSDVRSKGRAADPRTAAEQATGRALAGKERHEAHIRGHQLAEMRQAAETTREAEEPAGLACVQARVSKIETASNSGIDVVRAYIHALGGHIDVIASIGDQTWRLA